MTTATNTFEGGTNGTAVSTGNSGGASGTAFSYIDGPPKYSSLRAAHGNLSMLIDTVDGGIAGLAMSGSGTRWLRACVWSTSWSESFSLMYAEMTSGSYFSLELGLSSMALRHYNGTSTTDIATGTVAPATSQWIRVEMQCASDASGSAQARLFNSVDSTTASDSISGSRSQTSTTWTQASWRFTAEADTWFDDVGWSDTDWLGPATASASLPPRPMVTGLRQAVHRAAFI
ncbi:hypothetical protein ABT340_39685 [Streptosporangium sp. NPDC000239]|uniref:hypothetical protein n=1 Tax=Streptosporangium sp. NPDC000239 TaxID=3154248 RepID=UPI00331AFECF